MVTSLEHMDKDVLISIISKMHPSLDDVVGVILNSFGDYDEAIRNLKFMGASNIDGEKILRAYQQAISEKNKEEPLAPALAPVLPTPTSPNKQDSRYISGMDDIEDDEYDEEYDADDDDAAKKSTSSCSSANSSPALSPKHSRSSSPSSNGLNLASRNTSNNPLTTLDSRKNLHSPDRTACSRDNKPSVQSLSSSGSETAASNITSCDDTVSSPMSLDTSNLHEYQEPPKTRSEVQHITEQLEKTKISDVPTSDNNEYAWARSETFEPNKESEDNTLPEIDQETFHQYLDFLQMSFPDVSQTVIRKTLKECDYDPSRTSEQLLSINAIESQSWSKDADSDVPFPVESESDQDSESIDVSDVRFLTTSFPEIDKNVVSEVYSSNNEDLFRSLDELLTLQALSKGQFELESIDDAADQDLDPVAFLRMSFPKCSDKQINDALENQNGDVTLASDELLSAEVVVKYKEEFQLYQHREKMAQEEWERAFRDQEAGRKFQTPRSRKKKEKTQNENIVFLMENYNLEKKDAQALYELNDHSLFKAVNSIMEKTTKTQPIKHARLLTALDMKVQHPESFADTSGPARRTFKPRSTPSFAVSTAGVDEAILNRRTPVSPSTPTSATSLPSSNSTGSWNDSNVQQLVDEEQKMRMVYMRRAAEAYRKASANPMYRSVAGHYMDMARQHAITNNARLVTRFDDILARQTSAHTIDLHHLSVSYALDATRTKLENWWTREQNEGARNSLRSVQHLRIITGSGTHSVDNVPRIKNGVRKILLEGNWNFTEHRAHYDVYGQKAAKVNYR